MFTSYRSFPNQGIGRLYRHGDVLLKAIRDLPRGLEKHSGTTLASGEMTGHRHRIQETDRAQLWVQGNNLFLEIKGNATLVHEEHHPIVLPQGIYQVWRQREYRPEQDLEVED